MDTPLTREVAVLGVVWIDASVDFYLESYEDIETFEKGTGVLVIEKLSDPPRLGDFAAMKIPEEDLIAIPKCRVGDCEVKIEEENLTRLKNEIDWDAPDAAERANAMVRKMALDYVEAYRRGGNSELAIYRDKTRPNFVAAELRGLLENSSYLPVYLPEFHRISWSILTPSLPIPRISSTDPRMSSDSSRSCA